MSTSDNNSKQDLIKEILPDITESEREQLRNILGRDFESWSSVKESFINGWKSGNEKLVKVVASEEGFREKVGGYFTEERWIKGYTPEQMEHRLGFATGKLKNGATIYELNEIPDKSQFDVRGYTHILPKDGTGNSADYVPGSGINQFELNKSVSVPARIVGKVGYEEPWKGSSVEQNQTAVLSPLSSDSGDELSNEGISESAGEIAGNMTAGPVGGEVGKVVGETSAKAGEEAVAATGQSTEDPVKTNEPATKESSSEEEQSHGYGYGY